MDVRSHLIGNVRDLIFGRNEQQTSLRSVLIIWPRQKTNGWIDFRCFHSFDSLLEGMELMRPTAPGSLDVLQQVVDFCKSHPFYVWNGHPTRDAKRCRRLLWLCVHFGARQEGLDLLRLMGQDFEPDPAIIDRRWMSQNPDVFYVGLGSKNAKVVVEFVIRVAGWKKDSSEAILRLISSVRLNCQWSYFISLVRHLKYRRCLAGATAVTDQMCSIFIPFLRSDIYMKQVAYESSAVLSSFVEIVLCLETIDLASDPKRIAELIKLVPDLKCDRICDLIIHLNELDWIRSLFSSEDLMDALFDALLSCDLDPLVARDPMFLFKLLGVFQHYEGGSLLAPFVDRICSTAPLLKKTLLHLGVLKLDRATLCSLMAARMDSFKTPAGSEEEADYVRSLTVFFRLSLRMEMDAEMAGSLKDLFQLYLSGERQCQLLVDLWKSEGDWMKKKQPTTTSLDLFQELCEIFVATPSFDVPLPDSLVVDGLRFFDQFGDVALFATAVKKLTAAGEEGEVIEKTLPWNADQNDLVEKAIASLEPGKSDPTVFASLLSSWVNGYCRNPELASSLELGSGSDPITIKILHYIQLSLCFAEEKKNEPDFFISCFDPLLARLCDARMSQLVLDMRGMSSKLIERQPYWNFYRKLCRTFANRDLTGLICRYELDRSQSGALDLMTCFFWLNDAQVIYYFSPNIFNSSPP